MASLSCFSPSYNQISNMRRMILTALITSFLIAFTRSRPFPPKHLNNNRNHPLHTDIDHEHTFPHFYRDILSSQTCHFSSSPTPKTPTPKETPQPMLQWTIGSLSLLHCVIKLLLMGGMMLNFHRESSGLSYSFVYVLIGGEVKANLLVLTALKNQPVLIQNYGIFLAVVGLAGVMGSFLILPKQSYLSWQQCQGLFYYLFCCSNQYMLSQGVNLLLYSISPLLQVRFNIIRNFKNGVCPYARAIYFTNILAICLVNEYAPFALDSDIPIEGEICIGITLIAVGMCAVLRLQEKCEPFLNVIGYTKRKYAKFIEKVQGETGRPCAICLEQVWCGQGKGQVMKTPCNHFYHPSCLAQWLQVRLTCPLDNRLIVI